MYPVVPVCEVGFGLWAPLRYDAELAGLLDGRRVELAVRSPKTGALHSLGLHAAWLCMMDLETGEVSFRVQGERYCEAPHRYAPVISAERPGVDLRDTLAEGFSIACLANVRLTPFTEEVLQATDLDASMHTPAARSRRVTETDIRCDFVCAASVSLPPASGLVVLAHGRVTQVVHELPPPGTDPTNPTKVYMPTGPEAVAVALRDRETLPCPLNATQNRQPRPILRNCGFANVWLVQMFKQRTNDARGYIQDDETAELLHAVDPRAEDTIPALELEATHCLARELPSLPMLGLKQRASHVVMRRSHLHSRRSTHECSLLVPCIWARMVEL
jgi:hypothetical protein